VTDGEQKALDIAVEVRRTAQEAYGAESKHEDFSVVDEIDPEEILEDDGTVVGYWVTARVWVPKEWVKT